MEHQKSEALLLAESLGTIADKLGAGHPNTLLVLQEAATKLLRQHSRIQKLEAFAKEVEQYGVLLRASGAAPHDLKDLSAALEQCVELAQGVLK